MDVLDVCWITVTIIQYSPVQFLQIKNKRARKVKLYFKQMGEMEILVHQTKAQMDTGERCPEGKTSEDCHREG